MSTPYETALLFRDAAEVKRYHTRRMLREQSLAHHSFGVAMLVQQVFPECRKEVLLAAMKHDLPEYVTGDIPAPTKWASAAISIALEDMEKGTAPLYEDFGLTPAEVSALKWADMMELVLWSTEEVQMGNTYAMGLVKTGLECLWKGSWIGHSETLQAMHGIMTGASATARKLGIRLDTDATHYWRT